ncbi:MAG: hypothetical protein OEM97_10485, partial [Acidimicrobiia bacterium]|nr:hypothetical protein [Acidimicrobiia bacterium]
MKPGVEARVASARALGRILRGGAWSNVVVDAVSRSLSDDDRRLVRRLVFGTLRNLNRIDAGLDRHLARGLDATDTSVLDVLRIGAYEVTVGGGAHHGAVDSAVEAVREVGRPRASGLVNGVLRNVIRNRMEEPPIDDLAAKHGVAGWLVADLTTTLGSDGAAAFLASSETDAPRTARVRPGA